jgi:predicted DNA-binding protein (UPF0251 family)/predicted Fe-Mo cluster-binding NifX family protein
MVSTLPGIVYFKPRGIPVRDLTEIYLALEGFEALRLADLEGLSHAAAAAKMNVSRQTFGRILSQARHSMVEALVKGLALRIEGGDYIVADQNGQRTRDLGKRQDGSLPVEPQPFGRSTEKKLQPKEHQMEKIAVSAESPNLDDPLDPRFGRAAGFIIIDPTTQEFEYIDNGASQAMSQGAGIQAAEIVVRAGATVVLTGYVGPKAFRVLQASGIRVGQNLENLTVREAVARYASGSIEMAAGSDKEGSGR